jgi:hypothetical protein
LRIAIATFGSLAPSTSFAAWLATKIREEILDKMNPEDQLKVDDEVRKRMENTTF